MVDTIKNNIETKIEKSADELVFTYGVRGWNMDDCAKEAGITKRTLYRYVDSKEELIGNVLIRFIRTTQKSLASTMAGEKDFLRGLNKVLQIFPPMIMKLNSKIILTIFKDYPSIEKSIVKERLILASETIEFIERGQSKGYIKRDINAENILEILQSLVLYYMKNDPVVYQEKLQDSFSIVLNGILEKGYAT